MKTVLKYDISSIQPDYDFSGISVRAYQGKYTTFELPSGAKIVSIGYQTHGGQPALFLWAEVDTNKPPEKRRFLLIGTGQELLQEKRYRHVSTLHDGPFVWHVFEVLGDKK